MAGGVIPNGWCRCLSSKRPTRIITPPLNMATILTGFMAANLLQIGADDEKLQLLEAASVDLAKQIKSNPILAYRLTLVGLDEQVPVTDPAHKLVAAVVTAKWQTMTNKTGPGPVQIYRGVMLRGLEIAAADNPALRFAIALIARNQPERINTDEAKAAIATMLAGFEEAITAEMTTAWVNPVDMALPKLTGKIKKPQVDKDGMTQAFNADSVAVAIQSGAKFCAEDMQEALREIVQSWATGLEQLAIRDAKAELLWIRASQYSPSAKASLRTLNPDDLVLHAVLDVSRSVPAMAPPSVDYFLRELVSTIKPDRVHLTALLTSISGKLATQPEADVILVDNPLGAEGRGSWLERALRGGPSTSFEEQTGAPALYEDTFAEFAVKFYRELQIRKLLTLPQ